MSCHPTRLDGRFFAADVEVGIPSSVSGGDPQKNSPLGRQPPSSTPVGRAGLKTQWRLEIVGRFHFFELCFL